MADCNCFHPFYLDTDDDRKGFPPCDLTSSTTDSVCVEVVLSQFDSDQRHCDCNPACNEVEFETTLSMATWPSTQYKGRAMNTYGFSTTTTTNETINSSDSETNGIALNTDTSTDSGKSNSSAPDTSAASRTVDSPALGKNTTEIKREANPQPSGKESSEGDMEGKRPPPDMSDNLLRVSVYFNTLNERSIETKEVYDQTTTLSSLGGVFSLYLGISLGMLFELLEVFIDFLQNMINRILGKSYGRKYHKF